MQELYLEVTTRCNLACRTCVRNSWQEPLGDMDQGTFALLLRSLPQTLGKVQIAGLGEPLCHPDLISMIRQLKTKANEVELITNGLLLDQQMARSFLEVGLDRLILSIDGAEKETYRQIRGGSLAKLLGSLEGLSELKKSRQCSHPKIGCELVAMKDNIEEIPALIELVKRRGVEFLIVTNVLPYTDDMKGQILYGEAFLRGLPSRTDPGAPWERIRQELGEMPASLPAITWEQSSRYCRFARRRALAVSFRGEAAPCYPLLHSYPCHVFDREKSIHKHILGDIHQESLAAIWQAYQPLRARLDAFAFPDCPTCSGCDMVEANLEDCWGSSPACGDCLWAAGIIQCP